MIEAKRDYERRTLVIEELPNDFSGVTIVKRVWRDGHITSTLAMRGGHTEIKCDWQKLSDMK